jgi:hypothetical protein
MPLQRHSGWGAGTAFEQWGWGGSVATIALVQLLAGAIVVVMWYQPVDLAFGKK